MKSPWHYYLNLKITTRLMILCACYSLCIAATAYVGGMADRGLKVAVTGGFIILGACFGAINVWGIASSIGRVIGHLDAITQGEVDRVITVRRNNEVSKILKAIKGLASSLGEVLRNIHGASRKMEQSTVQLSGIARELAVAHDVQRTRMEEVSATTQEMSTISGNVMDLAGQVQALALAAEREAERGLAAAQENIAGMHGTLGEVDRAARDTRELILAAEHIRGIIGSITEIAQQTNLLALNASIEAAHAGTHGRGFAVVAGEVGKLAERTAKDAGDITRVITELSQRVDQAMGTMEGVVDQVRQAEGKTRATAQVLERMVSQVRQTAAANLRIAEVAQVQVARMNTMRSELEPLFELIQDSRAKGEITATISQDLTQVTEEFSRLMGRFTLELGAGQQVK